MYIEYVTAARTCRTWEMFFSLHFRRLGPEFGLWPMIDCGAPGVEGSVWALRNSFVGEMKTWMWDRHVGAGVKGHFLDDRGMWNITELHVGFMAKSWNYMKLDSR